MVEIREVRSKREQKEFLNFPLDLYRDNDCFVPPLYSDEKKIFSKKYVYNDICKAVYFNAYKDGKIVGRISGIIQIAVNEKYNEKRVRFTRFDSINDKEVAKSLFDAVENWALENGMDTVCGPLGFSDLEREGLLIEGFDELATFEEQYNADYYQTLIEDLGYKKEVDWTESKLYAPDKIDENFEKTVNFIMNRYKLKTGTAKNTNDFIKKYGDQIFELLDKSYANLYGTIPFTEGMKKMMIDNFKLIVDVNYAPVILDENDKLVCFGISFPSLARALQKSRGHLTPAALIRLLKAIKKPEIIDLALVGVDPELANHGISSIISLYMMKSLTDNPTIKYAETNLNLEDNYAIQNQWKRFKEVKHKKRRSYVKKIGSEN